MANLLRAIEAKESLRIEVMGGGRSSSSTS